MEKVQFDPTTREAQRDPYPHYRRLRDEAPVYLIKPLQAYALTRYEDCKNTFLHPGDVLGKRLYRTSVRRPEPVPEVPSMIELDPPEHTRLRKLAVTGFYRR